MPLAVAFSDQTIRVAIDGNGIVHMDIPSGESVISMAFPVSQLIKNIAACQRAVREWQGRATTVIPVAFDSKFERVYPEDKSA